MTLPVGEIIKDLGDPDKQLLSSRLAELSNLSPEELRLFEREWAEVESKRRRQILYRLVELAEDNFELNFDGIFITTITDEFLREFTGSLSVRRDHPDKPSRRVLDSQRVTGSHPNLDVSPEQLLLLQISSVNGSTLCDLKGGVGGAKHLGPTKISLEQGAHTPNVARASHQEHSIDIRRRHV